MDNKAKYFPLFLDISDKKMIVIGGGNVATRRILSLDNFDTKIRVVSPHISEAIGIMVKEKKIQYIKDRYQTDYIKDGDIVFACTNDESINHRIYSDCKQRGILVNNCSNKEECDFYFPGLIRKDEMVIGINGGGTSHSKVKKTREMIEDIL